MPGATEDRELAISSPMFPVRRLATSVVSRRSSACGALRPPTLGMVAVKVEARRSRHRCGWTPHFRPGHRSVAEAATAPPQVDPLSGPMGTLRRVGEASPSRLSVLAPGSCAFQHEELYSGVYEAMRRSYSSCVPIQNQRMPWGESRPSARWPEPNRTDQYLPTRLK